MNTQASLFDPRTITLLAQGFDFTEGPLWDPQGFFYFADVRRNQLHRIVPGSPPEPVRVTRNGNGLTFDLKGRLVQCEGDARRLTRWDPATGQEAVAVERADGKRFNRPNDVVCGSDGSLYFTDPDKRVPMAERELEAAVWRLRPDGGTQLVAQCEYPNGLAFSPDERRLYVANTRFQKYIHVLDLDEAGQVRGQRIFADMSAGAGPGVPDGLKVDVEGNVYCTGPGGIWVFAPDGTHRETQALPRPAVNFTFGGDDMRTLFVCAHESLFTVRMRIAGMRCPWQKAAAEWS